MKRYVCTVAVGLLLALAGTGTASADVGLPLPGQSGVQETLFGDQSVEKQENDADVTQEQGNGNINIAPAISIFGDAETENAQGNGNTAKSEVEQSNDVDQDQSSAQYQSLDESGSKDGCCDGQSQTGEQTTYGGDQTVEKQENDADVTQEQGNGNINIAPAFSVFGDAETKNAQGNGNYAESEIEQSNDVDQDQSSTQKQELDSKGDACCKSGSSQTGEQKTVFGDQTVGEQKNDADVTQSQGNENVSYAPAVAFGKKDDACSSKCGKSRHGGGDAKTWNAQGNGNVAKSDVEQKNDADQSQDSSQKQELDSKGDACCKHGQSQAGEQKVYGGDQTVGKQKNDADVTQSQGNGNYSSAPATTSKGKESSCSKECGKSRYPSHGQRGGDAETKNAQGNGNVAKSDVEQKNDVDQTQSSKQKQELTRKGGDCCKPKHDDSRCDRSKDHERSYDCKGDKPSYDDCGGCDRKPIEDCKGPKVDHSSPSWYDRPQEHAWKPENGHGCKPEHGSTQTGEQKVVFGDQTVEKQENDADVTQSQGNENVSEAEARADGGQSSYGLGGDAETWNAQGNGNYAWSEVDQQNTVDQTQTAELRQALFGGLLSE